MTRRIEAFALVLTLTCAATAAPLNLANSPSMERYGQAGVTQELLAQAEVSHASGASLPKTGTLMALAVGCVMAMPRRTREGLKKTLPATALTLALLSGVTAEAGVVLESADQVQPGAEPVTVLAASRGASDLRFEQVVEHSALAPAVSAHVNPLPTEATVSEPAELRFVKPAELPAWLRCTELAGAIGDSAAPTIELASTASTISHRLAVNLPKPG